MKLGEKLQQLRKQSGLSQEQLAARITVSRQAVSKWELGDATPEVDKLLALARTFGVTTDELLSEDEPIHEQEETPPDGATPAPAQNDVERTVGVFKGLLLRYGWRVGATLALIGLLIFLIGLTQRGEAIRDAERYASNLYLELGDGIVIDGKNAIVTVHTDEGALTMLLGGIVAAVGGGWAVSLYRKRDFGQKDG